MSILVNVRTTAADSLSVISTTANVISRTIGSASIAVDVMENNLQTWANESKITNKLDAKERISSKLSERVAERSRAMLKLDTELSSNPALKQRYDALMAEYQSALADL